MFDKITPDIIAAAITGVVFSLAGIGTYLRTRGGPKLAEGAYKIEGGGRINGDAQLERIAQALEDLVAANKDSFQRDMRERFEKLEEIMEHQAQEREARGEPRRR